MALLHEEVLRKGEAWEVSITTPTPATKPHHRIRHWSESNAGLQSRESLTFWLNGSVLEDWLVPALNSIAVAAELRTLGLKGVCGRCRSTERSRRSPQPGVLPRHPVLTSLAMAILQQCSVISGPSSVLKKAIAVAFGLSDVPHLAANRCIVRATEQALNYGCVIGAARVKAYRNY